MQKMSRPAGDRGGTSSLPTAWIGTLLGKRTILRWRGSMGRKKNWHDGIDSFSVVFYPLKSPHFSEGFATKYVKMTGSGRKS